MIRFDGITRFIVPLVLAIALLFQGAIGGVATLQSEAIASWDAVAAATICAAHDPEAPGDHQPSSPVHQHEHCALCGGVLPLVLPPAPYQVTEPVLSTDAVERPPATGPPGSPVRHGSYLSRAPPAIG